MAEKKKVDKITKVGEKGYDICGAKNGAGGMCKLPCGFGTQHKGTGRCKYHGGMSTGPKNPELLIGNKNGVKTGQFERIYGETLTEEEMLIANGMEHDKLQHIKEEIVITTIRERRMMQRISNIKNDISEMVLTGKLEMEGIGSSENNEGGGLWKQQHLQYTSKIEMIQRIEEALTKVQLAKTKQIELLHRFENGGAGETSAIDKLVARWEKEAEEHKLNSKQTTIKVQID